MNSRIIFGVMACLFGVILARPAMAQQRITGTVVDAQTHKPLAGANITYAQTKGTATDSDGSFRITCTRNMRIRVSFTGYQTTTETIKDCTVQVHIELKPSSYSLEKSTVEEHLDIREPVSTGTLNAAELNKQSGLRLKDALNTVPGVEMQTRSPFGGQRITIRGYYPNAGKSINFNGRGYQLFINHVPATDATGTTIMDDIDFSTLGRVKVIKGPSSLYGNEIAGAVNLYSQRPKQNGTTFSEEATVGSYGLFRDNTSVMTKTDDMDLRVNYGYQQYDSFRPQDASKKDYLSVSGHYKLSDRDMVSAYFSYNYSNDELAGGLTKDDFYDQKAIANANYVNNDGGVNIKGFRSGITELHDFNSHFSNQSTVFTTGSTLDQKFAHGFSYYNNLNVGGRTNFMYQQQFDSWGIDGQLGAFIQRSQQSVDGVFIPPFVKPPFTPDTKPQIPTNDQNRALNANIFTKWAFDLPHAFKVSVGALLNFNRFGIRNLLNNGKQYSGSTTQSKSFDPTFSPSASVLKSFGENVSVYASVSTGTTPPLLDDIIAENGSVNDQLKPEKAVQYEFGSKGNLLNNRLTYRLAFFDLEVSDRLVTQFKDGTSFTTNVGEEQNRGVELSLGYDLFRNSSAAVNRVRLNASYTYSDFTYQDFKVYAANTAGSDSTIADFSDNPVAGVAPHRLNLGIDVQTNPGFYLNAKYRYVDKTPLTFDNKTSVKAYNLLSARLGFRRNLGGQFNLDAYVGSNNITGDTYYNFLFVGQNEDDLGDGYIYAAPYKATVYGGINLSYNF